MPEESASQIMRELIELAKFGDKDAHNYMRVLVRESVLSMPDNLIFAVMELVETMTSEHEQRELRRN